MRMSWFRTAVSVGMAAIVSSCSPKAQERREAKGSDAIPERLEAMANAHYGESPHATWVVDSAASTIVPGLTYHWIIVRGETYHDGRYFTLARVGERLFDPEDLAAWSSLFGAWQPRDAREALSFCTEAALVGVIGSLQHLGDSASLTLDAELPRVTEHTRVYLTRAMNDTEIVPPSPERPAWDVRYWYLTGFPTHGSPLATKYRCQIPTDVRPLRIEAVDSIEA